MKLKRNDQENTLTICFFKYCLLSLKFSEYKLYKPIVIYQNIVIWRFETCHNQIYRRIKTIKEK